MNWRVATPEKWDGHAAIILAHGAGQGIDSPFMKFFHEALPAVRRGSGGLCSSGIRCTRPGSRIKCGMSISTGLICRCCF
jgi:hypothetical protein